MPDARILIVEDEAIAAMDIQQRLAGLGYPLPDVAYNGEEGVRKAEKTQPDLVLMDIMMPGNMDGVAAAEQIRSRFDIPVIFLTAYSDKKTLSRAKIAGPYGYIVKPFQERELLITVDMALYKHKMDKELKERQEWFATTLRSIGDGVIATDEKGLITFINPVAEALMGCKREEVMQRNLTEVFTLVNRDTHKPVENPVTRVLREGTIVGLANHTVLISRDGKEIPINDSAAPIKDEHGNILGVILVFSDVTERERFEEALRKSHDELEIRVRERTNELNALNAELDQRVTLRTAELHAANETLRASRVAALNLIEDAVTARRQMEKANTELQREIFARTMAKAELTRLNRTLKALSDNSQAIIRAKGEQEYLDDVCKIIVEDCGYRMVWIGFAEDDEAKSVRPVAHAGFEEGYLETLNITWSDTERGHGPTGTAIRTNTMTACPNMLIDPAFTPWREQAVKRGYASSIVFPLIAAGKAFGAVTIYSKEADPFSVGEMKLLTELADNISHGVEILRSREAREKAKQALQRSHIELAAVNEELESFIYSVSHDLRAPLRSISGFTKIVNEDYAQALDDKGKDYLSRIYKGAERMSKLIEDLLRLSRISKQDLMRTLVDLSKLALQSIVELRQIQPEKSVVVDIKEGLVASADERLIGLALTNLLGNAWKFTSKIEQARIEFGAHSQDEKIVYYIRDNGAGFDPAYASKMFLPFHRLHSESEFEGTGIGLTIVERVIRRHGGKVWSEGGIGKGATVYFTLG